MITKDNMLELMKLMAGYLKSLGLSEDETLGSIAVATIEAARNGVYKEDSAKANK